MAASFPTRTGPLAARIFLLILIHLAMAVAAQQVEVEYAPEENRAQASQGSRIWWNQPRFVEALALSEEQRSAMDALLEEHLAARREQGQRLRQARGGLAQSLLSADWTAAQEARNQLAEIAANLSRLETDLVISVVRKLSDTQRTRLESDFPRLLQRPWLLGRV